MALFEVVEQTDGGAASAPTHTRAVFDFEPIDDNTRTLVTITESSWPASPTGAQAAFGNCMGRSGMLEALKG